jgi:hypothetical protein
VKQQQRAADAHEADQAVLERALAAHKAYQAGRRPAWWWEHDDDAAAYREHPERYRRPWMVEADAAEFAAVSEPNAAGERAGRPGRLLDKLGRLCFLAAAGVLQDWEAEQLLADARTVRARAPGADHAGPVLEGRAVHDGLHLRVKGDAT